MNHAHIHVHYSNHNMPLSLYHSTHLIRYITSVMLHTKFAILDLWLDVVSVFCMLLVNLFKEGIIAGLSSTNNSRTGDTTVYPKCGLAQRVAWLNVSITS